MFAITFFLVIFVFRYTWRWPKENETQYYKFIINNHLYIYLYVCVCMWLAVYLFILVQSFCIQIGQITQWIICVQQVFLRKFQLTSLSFWFQVSQQPYKISVYAGIDMVHDQVEHALLNEVENLRTCQDHLKNIHERSVEQVGGKLLQ
jgi:hypothetical protein